MRIALDAMGGDEVPGPIVRGAMEAVAGSDDLDVVLVGDQPRINEALGSHVGHPRLKVVHTTQVVEMHEKPSVLRTKRDSSIARCWALMASREVDAVVSAGNTGAVAAGGLVSKAFLPGVKRPGIAVVIPTMRGPCVLLDVGANSACRPEHLFQYGVMGAAYARKIIGIDKPTIGLMNIGSEDGKGNDLVRETRELFLNSHVKENFFGNVEGRDLYHGTVNVLVVDGFVGNVVLKVSEGMYDMMADAFREQLAKSVGITPEIEGAFKALGEKYHHSSFGGAPLLGVDGVCLICHGGSRERAIRNALFRARQHSVSHLNEVIVQELARDPLPPSAE